MKTRVLFLDGIRGYAALWVMFGHAAAYTGFNVPVLSYPTTAVDVFMILSGFLMTQHFLARQHIEPWNSPRTWGVFAIRRFFRIAPLYYLALVPALLGFGYFSTIEATLWHETFKTIVYDPTVHTLSVNNILLHIFFLFGLFPAYCASTPLPDWSLGLEMQFYAAFPFLMIVAKRIGVVWTSLASVVVWGVFRALIPVYVTNRPGPFGLFPMPTLLPLKVGVFIVGILLAWAYMEDDGRLTARACFLCAVGAVIAWASGAIVAGVAVLIAAMLFQQEMALAGYGSRAIRTIQEFLGNRAARKLADLSYGVYLWHVLFLLPALSLVRGVPWLTHQPAAVKFLIVAGFVAPLSWGSAMLSFRLVEAPAIRLGRRLTKHLVSDGHPANLEPALARISEE